MESPSSLRLLARNQCRELFVRERPDPVLVAVAEVEGDLHWVPPDTPLPAPPRHGDTLGLVPPRGKRRYAARRPVPPRFATLRLARAGSYLMVGRSRGCDILLRDYSVSELHLKLFVVRGTSVCFVQDAGSRNGTWVDGWALPGGERRELHSGAELQVGRLVFQFLSAWDFYDHLLWSDEASRSVAS